MLHPNYLFVLDGPSQVFEDGFGESRTTTVAAADFMADHEYPGGEGRAYKARGSHGDVYIPEDCVRSIVDLGDAVQPAQMDGVAPEIVPVPDYEVESYREWAHGPVESDEFHRLSLQDGPEAGFGAGFVRLYDGNQEEVVELDSAEVTRLLAAAVGFDLSEDGGA
jgi:hypothetical protein